MNRLLLTSAGFENPDCGRLFLDEIGIIPEEIRVFFIPTAAITPDAIAMLPACRRDLTELGITEDHITVFDLDRPLTDAELSAHHAFYVCGGSPSHLLERMNAAVFPDTLRRAFAQEYIYVGVSAGSIVCCANLKGNLGYHSKRLSVHCNQCEETANQLRLTNNQALWIRGDMMEIIG